MVWIFMIPIALLTSLGVCPAVGMPPFKWWCCLSLLVLSVGWMTTELVILWTIWSKEAEVDGAVIYSDHVCSDHEEDEQLANEHARKRVEEYLSEDVVDPRLDDKYSY